MIILLILLINNITYLNIPTKFKLCRTDLSYKIPTKFKLCRTDLSYKIPTKFKLYRTDLSYKFNYNIRKKNVNYLLQSNLNYIKI